MVLYRWREIAEGGSSLGEQLADGARKAACTLYNDYAKNYVPKNPLNAPIRYFWDSVCDDPVPPPPPPFTGGQCSNVRYRVSINYAYRDDTNTQRSSTVNIVATGKILGVFFVVIGSSVIETGPAKGKTYTNVDIFLATEFDPRISVARTGWIENTGIVSITGIVRVDGQPDNCGNPSGEYPQPPQLPPGGANYDVKINDRSGNEFNITLNYNDASFNMPVSFNFEGGFIAVDIGGVSINWSGDFNWNPGGQSGEGSRSPFPESPPPGTGGGGTDPQPGDDDVEEKPPKVVEEDEEEKEQDSEEEEIIWVRILMLKPPYPKHTILYKNPNLNIYYGGWLAWTDETGLFNSAEEIPIRRSRTLLKKPSEYKGYIFRAINGASYQVTSYTQKKTKRQPSQGSES